MTKSKFTDEQITFALREVESGRPVADVGRNMAISEATFYVWKKRCGHLGVTELGRLRQLEDENNRLKRLVPDRASVAHRTDVSAPCPNSQPRAPQDLGRSGRRAMKARYATMLLAHPPMMVHFSGFE